MNLKFINKITKITRVLFLVVFFLLLFSTQAFSLNLKKDIRVGLDTKATQVTISTSTKGGIFNHQNIKVYDLNPLQNCLVKIRNGKIEVFVGGKKVILTKRKITLKALDKSGKYIPLVYAKNHWYRGQVDIFPSKKSKYRLTIVNKLSLREYLYGVVSSEMPSSWPLEALKSQAVAARTYALKDKDKVQELGFDVYPTIASQVYKGAEGENPITNRAVDQTKGKVISYDGEIITAYFSSSAGGLTEDGFEVWEEELPYLKPVKDNDKESPRAKWYKTFNNEELQWVIKKKLKKGSIGQITDIVITEYTKSDRARIIKFKGTKKTVTVKGIDFRIASKVYSTRFRVYPVNIGTSKINGKKIPRLFQFYGRGWGHGTGLSQWGARQMALDGKKYQQILHHYYSGIKIVDYNSL